MRVLDRRGSPVASRRQARRWLAGLQGASYLYFASWSILRRSHYRRVHRLNGAAWLLNAHGLWLTLAGTVLTWASMRDRAEQPEVLLVGLGASSGLAVVDLTTAATDGVAPIYYADLALETLIAFGWLTRYGGGPRDSRSQPGDSQLTAVRVATPRH